MEAKKRYIKNRGLLVVLGLILSVFSIEVRAMWMSPSQKKAYVARQLARKQQMEEQIAQEESLRQQVLERDYNTAIAQKMESLEPGQFFVYEKGTTNGIVVPRNVLEKSSVLKSMVGKQSKGAIPLAFSLVALEDVFGFLMNQRENQFDNYFVSLDRLIDRVNCVYELNLIELMPECSRQIINTVVRIEKDIQLFVLGYRDGKSVSYPECGAFRKLNVEAGKIFMRDFIEGKQTGFTGPHLVFQQIYYTGKEYKPYNPVRLPRDWTLLSEIERFESIGQYVCFLCDQIKEHYERYQNYANQWFWQRWF